MVTNKEIENNKDILPGDMGVSLAKVNDGDICSCVINGIVTNAIVKTDVAKHERVIVVPGGTSDEPYIVSAAVLIKGDYDGLPVNIAVDADGNLQIELEGFTAKNEPATENPILDGMEYEALGALTTDADAPGDKVPWKASQKGVPYVSIVDSQGAAEASVEAANTARTIATILQAVQHIGANGSPMPSGASVADPIHVSTGGAVASTVGDGRQVVTTAGTRVALAVGTIVKEVTITAETDNTDIVVIGGTTVIAALATRRGTPLYPTDSITVVTDDLAEVYLDSLVNGEGVTYSYLV